jgi:hypothetical protein
MKKDEFNIYEFHQNLLRDLNPVLIEEINNERKKELEHQLSLQTLIYTDELKYKRELNRIEYVKNIQESIRDYTTSVTPILSSYKDLLNCTVKGSFTKKKVEISPEIIERKKKCIDSYLQYIRIFPALNSYLPSFEKEMTHLSCADCNVNYELYESIMICPSCYCEQPFSIQEEAVSFKDLSRINNNMKFSYIRQTHFKDTIKQFQGKQNKFIDENVFTTLENCIIQSELNKTDKNGKYHLITKDHIKMFLQENGLYKYYEDMNLIYSKITGTPCPDISKYEKQLLEDFEQILVVYDKVIKNDPSQYTRSNFLNSYYVLYQLLKKNGYPCKESDFPLIKTVERKIEHDEIYEKCCTQLGWSFYPTV